MSRDATGFYSGRAMELVACPLCGAKPGHPCDTTVSGYTEHSVHFARTESMPVGAAEAAATSGETMNEENFKRWLHQYRTTDANEYLVTFERPEIAARYLNALNGRQPGDHYPAANRRVIILAGSKAQARERVRNVVHGDDDYVLESIARLCEEP